MIDERMEALASRQHGLISHEQAVTLGFSESAIRHRRSNGRLSMMRPRVYRLAGAIETASMRANGAVLAAGDGAVLSHTSAAAIAGLPGFTIDPVVITMPRRWPRPLDGVRVEQSLALPGHHVHVAGGIPCTTMARTLFDLCGDVHAARAERALDTALSRKLVTRASLCRVLDDLAQHGRAGTVLFRTLLEERTEDYVPPESELEARLIEVVRRFGLPVPERQVDLGDDVGWIGRVDFVFRGARLVVEVDGAEFHDGVLDRRRDADRDARLAAAGWFVLRFRWDDVVNRPAAVARSIRFRCAIASP